MAYRKRTLRTMSPTARKVARLAGDLDSVSRRLKNLIPDLQSLDLDSKALFATKHITQDEPADLPDKLTYESTGIEPSNPFD